jgi:hypothetical protein
VFHGFVVRAETETRARTVAQESFPLHWMAVDGRSPWFNPVLSMCVELTTDGDEEVVMAEFSN